jgi:hypothetical protein
MEEPTTGPQQAFASGSNESHDNGIPAGNMIGGLIVKWNQSIKTKAK